MENKELSNQIVASILDNPAEGHITSTLTEAPPGVSDASVLEDDPTFATAHESRDEPTVNVTNLENIDHVSVSVAPALNIPHIAQLTGSLPPHKRFNAVNINKKFLEKNSSSSTSGAGHSSLGTTNGKQAGVIARPAPQTASSHSRLVTTKLTPTPQSSASSVPGWSRPSSATPPAASSNAALPGNSQAANGPSTSPSTPQVPPLGKVIQPLPMAPLKQKGDSMGAAVRPAWGNVQQTTGAKVDLRAQTDFPTAAEAAKGTVPKVMEVKVVDEAAAAQKQAMLETADTFRGVHLDPNAHHWDEMEEDDNDFLDGVIEFGDGTQYKIHAIENKVNDSQPHGTINGIRPAQDLEANGSSNLDGPVSKEERFADDFDRSWPRSSSRAGSSLQESHRHPIPHEGALPSTMPLPVSSAGPSHDSNHSRVLFNERSNRMEPYASGNRQGSSHGPHSISHNPLRRDNQTDLTVSHNDIRRGRDAPPHGLPINVQVLQKPAGGDFGRVGSVIPSPQSLSFGGDNKDRDGSANGDVVPIHPPSDEKVIQHQGGGTDSTALLPLNIPSVRSPSRERDRNRRDRRNPMDRPHTSVSGSSDTETDHRASHSSEISPVPSSYSHNADRDRSRDIGRQLPPHLSGIAPLPPPPLRKMSSRDVLPSPGTSATPAHPSILSPASARTVIPSPVSELSQQSLPSVKDSTDVDALHKAFLHDSAERAKQRRQQEEEERAKAQERAKKKAAELEARMKAGAEHVKAHVEEPKSGKGTLSEEQKAKTADESEVLKIIEDAATSILQANRIRPIERRSEASNEADVIGNLPSSQTQTIKTVDARPPTVGISTSLTRRPSQASSSRQAESWRSKASPLSATSPPLNAEQGRSSMLPPPSVIPDHQSFDIQPGEELEVVDFSDLGKLVDEGNATELTAQTHSLEKIAIMKPPRAVASDFFQDGGATRETAISVKAGSESWRGSTSQLNGSWPKSPLPVIVENTPAVRHERLSSLQKSDEGESDQHGSKDTAVKRNSGGGDGAASSGPSQTIQNPTFTSIRPPKAPSVYREAPMSALNDTMSRIKGALDGMQSPLPSTSDDRAGSGTISPSKRTQATLGAVSAKESRWLPPALRSSYISSSPHYREPLITHPEPPTSPRLTSSTFFVRLPKGSKKFEPLTKRQFHLWKNSPGQTRLNILCLDPLVEHMTRNMSVNDILFRKPQVHKSKLKIKVFFPKVTPRSSAALSSLSKPNPKVNIPVIPKTTMAGAFGRPKVTDDSNWRRPTASASKTEEASDQVSTAELNVISRSPPPEPASTLVHESTEPRQTSPVPKRPTPIKSKAQQKLPVGADIAFYRDLRRNQDDQGGTSLVSFTVTSELDVLHERSTAPRAYDPDANTTHSSITMQPSTALNLLDSPRAAVDSTQHPTSISSKVGSHLNSLDSTLHTAMPSIIDTNNFEESTPSTEQHEIIPITPPAQSSSSTWGKSPLAFHMKESPARAPNSEHLKAVWSQTSNREVVPTVNSLKGIADDLTAVPFTLHEVKSEDGGTPPPATAAAPPPPPRMSASDVARAFQTVPAGPANQAPIPPRNMPFSPPLSSPSNVHTLPRTPNLNVSYSPLNSNVRPPFTGYPSPITSHSPSPTLLYAHHPTNPMPSTPSTPYGQPIWMPLSGPIPQQSAQLIRPQNTSSPYSHHQLLPYSSPGGPAGMYPALAPQPNTQLPPGHFSNGAHARMALVSPVMPQANPVHHHLPMYAASPVLVHAPPPGGTPSPQSFPAAVGMGRGMMPVRNSYESRPPIAQMQAAPGSRLSAHSPGYTHVPPTSFVRPSW